MIVAEYGSGVRHRGANQAAGFKYPVKYLSVSVAALCGPVDKVVMLTNQPEAMEAASALWFMNTFSPRIPPSTSETVSTSTG